MAIKNNNFNNNNFPQQTSQMPNKCGDEESLRIPTPEPEKRVAAAEMGVAEERRRLAEMLGDARPLPPSVTEGLGERLEKRLKNIFVLKL